ncbi:hypothetical protein EDD11_006803 [Mortierella claussenii]|nr:hypothetical protein EDD11_006803 [Mortierella claussenii]
MARFTSKLTLVLGLCAALALARAADQAAVDTRPEVICNDGACYPRVFRPTSEFQEVLYGQEIPSGLHVQMDFETHKKFAKLMDPEAVSEKDPTNSILVVDTETPGTFQHQVGSDNRMNPMPPAIDLQHPDDRQDFAQLEENSRLNLQSAFDSIPELVQAEASEQQQQDPEQVQKTPQAQNFSPMSKQSDHQIFMEQLDVLKTSRDHGTLLAAMEELSDLASDMDFGLRLSEGDGLKTLVSHLHCSGKSDSECEDARLLRAKSALILGTAVQNHEKARNAAYKNNLHKALLAHLETETDSQVLRRLIFAYGSLVRGTSADNDFIRDDDISRLAEVYRKSTDPSFKRKCVYVMSDFADPDMQFVSADDTMTAETENGHAQEEKNAGGHDDFESINRTESMTVVEKNAVDVGPWCEMLQQENLTVSGAGEKHEDWEIIERAVELLHASYPETCILVDNDKSSRDEL